MVPGDPGPYGRPSAPSATSICTEPSRHAPKGASTLKVKAAPKPPKRQPTAEDVKAAKERQERNAAGTARRSLLAGVVAEYKPVSRQRELTVMLRGAVGRMIGWDTAEVAGGLLGLVAEKAGWQHAVQAAADKGPVELHRAALALAFATVESGLDGPYARFDTAGVAEHYAYLAGLGYQPSPWEQAKLDEATATDAGNR